MRRLEDAPPYLNPSTVARTPVGRGVLDPPTVFSCHFHTV